MKFHKNQYINKQRANNKREADILITASYKAFMVIGLMSLRDEFGFGAGRLARFIDKVDDTFDSYNKGYVSLKDLSSTIEKETGIKVL